MAPPTKNEGVLQRGISRFLPAFAGLLLVCTSSSAGTVQDDPYEENDTQIAATDLTSFPGTWLSSIDGPAVAADDDWYQVRIEPGQNFLVVTALFSQAEGDIDIELYDAAGTFLNSSVSTTDNEGAAFPVPSNGDYFLRVFPFDLIASGTYDLQWSGALIRSRVAAISVDNGIVRLDLAQLKPGSTAVIERSETLHPDDWHPMLTWQPDQSTANWFDFGPDVAFYRVRGQ